MATGKNSNIEMMPISTGRKTIWHLQQMKKKGEKISMVGTAYLDPIWVSLAEKAGVDFQLSGHTHRGQVWPISWITDALYECSWGEHQRGATRYYVSSGIGLWGGKFRIGTQSEYVVATLRKN